MRTNLLKFFALLVFSFSVQAGILEPSYKQQSDCKDNELSYEDENPTLESTVSYNDGILTLSVENYPEQCAPLLNVTCNADIPGELHFIISDEAEEGADCMCYFDVICKYEGILTGHYKIYLESPWGTKYLETEVDIEPGCEYALGTPSAVSLVGAKSGNISLISENILKLDFEGKALLDIYDSAGRQRGTLSISGPSEINISSLPKGIYLVKVSIGDSVERYKFIR